jgi:hypothetical protein
VIDTLREKNFDSTKWMELGLTLGLAHIRLKEVEKNYRDDCSRCLTEAMALWLNGADEVEAVGLPCWDTLADALKRLKEYTIADDVAKQKHKRNPSITSNTSSDLGGVVLLPLVLELDDKQKELEKKLEKVDSELELLKTNSKDVDEVIDVEKVKQVKDDKSNVVKQTFEQAKSKGKNIVMSGVSKSITKGIDIITKSKRNNNN